MLLWPISSPKMTRMLGLRPDGAAGVSGAACCVWASASETSAAAATRVDVPSSRFRRLRAQFSVLVEAIPSGFLVVTLLGIRLSILQRRWYRSALLSYFNLATREVHPSGLSRQP